jgi:hypothetical protein
MDNYNVLKITWGPIRVKYTRNGLERDLRELAWMDAQTLDTIMRALDAAYARYLARKAH